MSCITSREANFENIQQASSALSVLHTFMALFTTTFETKKSPPAEVSG